MLGKAVAALAVLSSASTVAAQGLFNDTGTDSFYWHNRYHGLLAMAAYAPGGPASVCNTTFTNETLALNYPDSTDEPFTVLSTWGPTPKYGLSGYNVRVPEMNKVVMVFATLTPFTGVGGDDTYQVHAGALEAFYEAQNATNDWQAIKDFQGDFVWSAAGHGFGGMVAQVASFSLKYRTLSYSCMTFGSPAVFNDAAAAAYNELFPAEDSQRTISHDDIVPSQIYVDSNSNYTFVNTGVHLFGANAMYGQNYTVCYDESDVECWGGDSYDDHWFYYTPAGLCGSSVLEEFNSDIYNTYNVTVEASIQNALNASYYATATAPIRTSIDTSLVYATTISTTTSTTPTAVSTTTTSAPASTTTPAVAAADASTSSVATASAGNSALTSGAGVVGVQVGAVVGVVGLVAALLA
ncbi:protein of lipase, class 3 family [Pseudohyphozyma bogoriensis]|nr:protein of lipase, class 3 family [Pseudohyphozyma bogoriensis]